MNSLDRYVLLVGNQISGDSVASFRQKLIDKAGELLTFQQIRAICDYRWIDESCAIPIYEISNLEISRISFYHPFKEAAKLVIRTNDYQGITSLQTGQWLIGGGTFGFIIKEFSRESCEVDMQDPDFYNDITNVILIQTKEYTRDAGLSIRYFLFIYDPADEIETQEIFGDMFEPEASKTP